MLYELDSQLSQLSQAFALEDREQLEEATAQLRYAKLIC
jgi:hypothetical protein